MGTQSQRLAAETMNIFLIGATGTIGGELAPQLTVTGHAVIALVKKNRDIHTNDGRLLGAEDFTTVMPRTDCISRSTGDVALSGLGLDEGIVAFLCSAD